MRKTLCILVITIVFGLMCFVSSAQENSETEIKNLENMEGEAWVKKDSATLFTLFSPELIVNTPLNKVATLEAIKQLIRADKIDISSFKKVIEKITFINNMAVVMGHDIVKPQGAMENAGRIVTRRYTNIWIKNKANWRLAIRQATNISVL